MGFKAVPLSEIKEETVEGPEFKGVKVRWLIAKEDGAENFAMRYFEIEPGGHSAYHSHAWEHETFILDGECLVKCGDTEKRATPGYVIFIPPNTVHNFKNVGNKALKFLCLVPYEK